VTNSGSGLTGLWLNGVIGSAGGHRESLWRSAAGLQLATTITNETLGPAKRPIYGTDL